ncbi:hypothetical protein C5167_027886 [Papaver somniferum]|nr:hypothetical protein C5167_027886 [Papaver somniferum]
MLKFQIQLRVCVESTSSSSSSSSTASSSSSSCISSNEVVVVEYLTDDSSLFVRVPKKSDALANILSGVGNLFEGGVTEVRNAVTKYKIHNGYKYCVGINTNVPIILS